MEETKENKLSYEELEKIAKNFQQRLIIAESRLNGIDFVAARLTWLFKVLEHKDSLDHNFVANCALEIESLLTIEENNTEEHLEDID